LVSRISSDQAAFQNVPSTARVAAGRVTGISCITFG
jgi:hypothetical protein